MRIESIGNLRVDNDSSYLIEREIVSVDLSCGHEQTGAVFHLGTLVRELRKARGETIVGLSEKAGVNKNTWSRFERTGVRFEDDTLSRIATALDLTPADLYALAHKQSGRIRTALVGQLDDHKDVEHAPSQRYPPSPSPIAVAPATEGDVLMADDPDREELLHCFSLLRQEARTELLRHARALTATALTERNRGGAEARQRKKTVG
jgi:transcriptional regulator with XRE-family HTH domain